MPKEELLRRVWPDTFVEEANLSVNVSILRKALGEQPDGRAWIQTVARRGYRFLGAVRAQAKAPRSLAVLPFRSLGDRRGRRRARPGHGGRAHHAARGDRPRGGAAHRHRPPLRVPGRRPRGGGATARSGRGRRRAAAALGLAPAPHRPAGPDRRGGAPLGRPLRRGVHAPLRRRGHGGRARGGGPRGGAEHRGAPAARPPPDGEPRGLPGLLPRSLLLGPLLPALGREGHAELPRGHGPRPPLCAAARGPRGRVPRGRLRRRSPAARGLGARRRSRPGRRWPSTTGSRSPTSRRASFASCRTGTGTAPSASCGVPSTLAPDSTGASPVARPRAGPSRPRRRGGPDAAAGRRAGPAVPGRLRSRRPAPRVRRRARGRARPGPAHPRARPAPVPRPLGGRERPFEPRAPRRGGGRAPPRAGPGRGHGLHEAGSRPQPGPGRPGGRGAGAPGPGGPGRHLTVPGGDRPSRAGRDEPRARAPGLGGGRARPLDRAPRRRPADATAAGPPGVRGAGRRVRSDGRRSWDGPSPRPSRSLACSARREHARVTRRPATPRRPSGSP